MGRKRLPGLTDDHGSIGIGITNIAPDTGGSGCFHRHDPSTMCIATNPSKTVVFPARRTYLRRQILTL